MKLIRFLVVSIFLIVSAFNARCWAWTGDGHSAIARAAFQRLTTAEQQYYQTLLAAGPWVKPGLGEQNHLLEAIAWPDKVRILPLKYILTRYGSGEIPADLESFAKMSTQDWHYASHILINSEGKVLLSAGTGKLDICAPSTQGRLLTIWPTLVQTYQKMENPKDKAILLAFIAHMLTDAYQPLHLMASVNKSCDQDRGGNLYCISPSTGFFLAPEKIAKTEKSRKSKCKKNLHSVWDKGMGVFKSELKNNQQFSADALSLSPALAHIAAVAEYIYPATPADFNLSIYQRKSRLMIEQLANQGSAHLHRLLVVLAKSKNDPISKK
jgi:hypothetical protein